MKAVFLPPSCSHRNLPTVQHKEKMVPLVEPDEVLTRGLAYLSLDVDGRLTREQRINKFQQHYGSVPLTIATMWYDLCHTTIEEAKLSTKDKQKGFRMFMVAHFFIYSYPRSSVQLGDRFRICACNVRGKNLWKWIRKIAALEEKVIFWPHDLNNPDSEIFALSVDGVDKKTWERKHKTELLPFDRRNFSQKHAHGGVKYQITLCAYRQQVVDIFGPVRGGMGDKEMLERSGVLEHLADGKKVVADRGYIKNAFRDKVAWPNPQHDSRMANNIKSRIRLRHESFNGKMSTFASMHQTWRHSDTNHGLAFRAVAVTLQYAMNNGSSHLFQL